MDGSTEDKSETHSANTVLGRLNIPFYYGWIILGVVFLAEFCTAGMGGSTIVIFFTPITEEMGWSLTALLAALSAQSILGMATAPLVGPLLDRFGAKPVMLFGAVSAGIGLILLVWVQAVWQFWVVYAVVGALGLNELGRLSGPVVVSKWFVRRRGRAMAIATSGTSVGTMVMAPLIGWLIVVVGWRHAFAVLGVILMVMMIPPVLLFMKRQPEDMGLLPDGDTPEPQTRQSEGSAGTSPASQETAWTLGQAVKTRTLWILVASMNMAGLAAGSLIYLQMPYLTAQGMSN
ncbi:MAG: MFS transporter, partial [Dehalococcoidia bacterium]